MNPKKKKKTNLQKIESPLLFGWAVKGFYNTRLETTTLYKYTNLNRLRNIGFLQKFHHLSSLSRRNKRNNSTFFFFKKKGASTERKPLEVRSSPPSQLVEHHHCFQPKCTIKIIYNF